MAVQRKSAVKIEVSASDIAWIKENISSMSLKIQEVNSDNKKKKKNDKNIFIPNKIDKTIIDKSNNDDSVFIKTEVINKNDLFKIYQSFKSTSKLDEIQNLALKIGLKVFAGATKDGKPKNKTKSELLEDIKNYLEKK